MAASAHTHHLNEGLFLGRLQEIKIQFPNTMESNDAAVTSASADMVLRFSLRVSRFLNWRIVNAFETATKNESLPAPVETGVCERQGASRRCRTRRRTGG